jgi:hypothetical protein
MQTNEIKNSYCDYAFIIPPLDNLYSDKTCVGCKLKQENVNAKVGKFCTLEGFCSGMEVNFEPAGVGGKGVKVNLSFNKEKTFYCPDNPDLIRGI